MEANRRCALYSRVMSKTQITQEKAARITNRFNQLLSSRGFHEQCPLCGDSNFQVPLALVVLPVQEMYPDPFGVSPKGQHYACAPLICFTCGNTFLLNLKILDGDTGQLKDIYSPDVSLRDF